MTVDIEKLRELLASVVREPWMIEPGSKSEIRTLLGAEINVDWIDCGRPDRAELITKLVNNAEELLDEYEEWQDCKPTFDWRTRKLGEVIGELERYKRALEVAVKLLRFQKINGGDYAQPGVVAGFLDEIDRILEGGDE